MRSKEQKSTLSRLKKHSKKEQSRDVQDEILFNNMLVPYLTIKWNTAMECFRGEFQIICHHGSTTKGKPYSLLQKDTWIIHNIIQGTVSMPILSQSGDVTTEHSMHSCNFLDSCISTMDKSSLPGNCLPTGEWVCFKCLLPSFEDTYFDEYYLELFGLTTYL